MTTILKTALMAMIIHSPLSANVISNDKYQHALASAGIAYAVTSHVQQYDIGRFKSVLVGFLATMALGYTKERLDSRFDKDDLRSDAVGALSRSMIALKWDF